MRLTLLKSATAALVIAAVLTLCPSSAQAGVIGPILPYYGLAQSPFDGLPFSYFYLETFEEPGAPTFVVVTA